MIDNDLLNNLTNEVLDKLKSNLDSGNFPLKNMQTKQMSERETNITTNKKRKNKSNNIEKYITKYIEEHPDILYRYIKKYLDNYLEYYLDNYFDKRDGKQYIYSSATPYVSSFKTR